jgi:HlyD family secretion protein
MFYTQSQKFIPAIGSNGSDEHLPPINYWTSLVGMVLVGAVGTGIVLSSWIKYNVTVKTAAVVRPIGEIRVVQSELEGTVKEILVKENQRIKQGDVIAYLDTEQLQIKKNQLQDIIQQYKLQSIQINAQIQTLNSQILAEKRVIERTIASARADLLRHQRDYQQQKITTQSELLAAQASFQQAQADLLKAKSSLNFAKVDRDRYQQLAQIGAIGRREFEQKKLVVQQAELTLEAEQKSVEIAQIKIESARAAINPSMAMVRMAQERIAQEIAKGESIIATLNKEKQLLFERQLELQTQFKRYQKELQQLETQIKSSTIVATSNGTIFKLNLRNSGQVVRTSESIAEIVPDHTAVVIKAMIPVGEIKKVTVGQNAQLRVDSCPYPDYGTLQGVVKSISPDIITNQNNNTMIANSMSGYFEATIQPKSLSFGNRENTCYLQSGMSIKADIVSQEETLLKFILRKARLITDL